MSAPQLEAALGVAQAALSSAGYGTFHGIRRADDFLGTVGPSTVYDSGIYFIAFIGTPSSTGEWILQLGGHHYALNFYYHGSVESPTPYFTGMNPSTFTLDGQSYSPLKPKVDVIGLDATQRAAARLTGTFGDVLLGPGADHFFPPPSGLKVSTLSASARFTITRSGAMRRWTTGGTARSCSSQERSRSRRRATKARRAPASRRFRFSAAAARPERSASHTQ